MLETVGISSREERIYTALLEAPSSNADELARLSQSGPLEVAEALEALQVKGLVKRSANELSRFVPAPPDVGMEVLILRRQQELEAARQRVAELMETYRRAADASDTTDLVEIVQLVRGKDAIRQRAEHLQRSARKEVVGFARPPYVGPVPNETQLQLLRQGVVRYRTLYDRNVLETGDPGRSAAIAHLVRGGEEARTLGDLPLKVLIADRRLALIPLTRDGTAVDQAISIRPCSLLDALSVLFETLWSQAAPILPGPRGPMSAPRETTVPDQDALLTLLGAGVSDQGIARELGVSLRTVTRRIRALSDACGAGSRFQLGWQAAKRGRL